jgi:type I restriction enzyme, S subunit
MATEWKAQPLEDCMAAIIDYRGKTPRKTSSGIPLITAKVVKGGRIAKPDEFIAEEDYESWMRRGMPEAKDVVITTEAPLGEVAQLGTERVALAQRLIALRGKQGILDNTFLKYLMQSSEVQDQLRARASGTTVFGIRQSELRKVMLTLPPFTEQRAIAKVLGTMDDKTELNRQMSETLEGMSQALFKSWFVDFDPVRAKSEGRDPGLPKHLADLFPSSLSESELGKIPTTWGVKKLGDLIELAYGKALKEENRRPGKVAVYGSNGQVGWHDEKLANAPGVIVGRKGNPGVVTWASTDFFAIDTTFYVIPQGECKSLYFLYYALRAHDLASLGADSAVPGLNRNMVYMSQQLVPATAVLDVFDQLVRPIFERIHKSNEQSSSLTTLRDTLLPKLISGELRLPDAERIVGGQM